MQKNQLSLRKAALEAMEDNVIPAGTVAVSRQGPDGQLGYSWNVTFLSDYHRTFFGDLPLFTFDSFSNFSGFNASAHVMKVREGTQQEVQRVSVTAISGEISNSSAFSLRVGDYFTQPILSRPTNNSCISKVTEVQTITTSTIDTTTAGGDFDVSMYLVFRLRFGQSVTSWIDANKVSKIQK
jgi:hypothetical protein